MNITHPKTISEAVRVIEDSNIPKVFRAYHTGEPDESTTVPGAVVIEPNEWRALKLIIDLATRCESVEGEILARTSPDLRSLARLFAEESKDACRVGALAVEAIIPKL